ncbi:hypothetical protein BH09BAC3_BH09BAC3_07030 [soil metagenome]
MTKTKNLLNNFSPEEIATAFVLPLKLSPDEKKAADKQLAAARLKKQAGRSEDEKLLLRLMQLRYRLENYIRHGAYDEKYRFSYFLNEYLNIIDRRSKEFAKDIDIHKTFLSQLMNNRREPNESIMVRLEIHSNNILPAIYWLRLLEKSKEHDITTNTKLRKKEGRFVKNKLELMNGTGTVSSPMLPIA